MMRSIAVLFCALSLMVGCGNNEAQQKMGGGEAFFYPDLEIFDSETLLGISYPAAKGNWVEVKKYAKGKTFSEGLSKFEASQLPDAHKDRQPAKDALVASVKAFQEKIDSNAPNPDLEAAFKDIKAKIADLRKATN